MSDDPGPIGTEPQISGGWPLPRPSPTPADALREALEGFVRWWDQGGRLMPPDAIEEAREVLAAAPAPGLDMERERREAGIDVLNHLSAAVGEIADDPSLDGVMGLGFDAIKQLLDAEYARLAGQEGGE